MRGKVAPAQRLAGAVAQLEAVGQRGLDGIVELEFAAHDGVGQQQCCEGLGDGADLEDAVGIRPRAGLGGAGELAAATRKPPDGEARRLP